MGSPLTKGAHLSLLEASFRMRGSRTPPRAGRPLHRPRSHRPAPRMGSPAQPERTSMLSPMSGSSSVSPISTWVSSPVAAESPDSAPSADSSVRRSSPRPGWRLRPRHQQARPARTPPPHHQPQHRPRRIHGRSARCRMQLWRALVRWTVYGRKSSWCPHRASGMSERYRDEGGEPLLSDARTSTPRPRRPLSAADPPPDADSDWNG